MKGANRQCDCTCGASPYPIIADRARAEDAEIHWGDETAVVNTDVRARGYLNADLKHALASKVQVRTKDKLKQFTTEHMNMLQSKPERVRSYSADPKVKYAA
jgi:hypothetical protein